VRDLLHKIINNLPANPGVYQFIGGEGKIIYIGKAKNLKNRVGSYFQRNKYDSFRIKKLTSQVTDIKYIVVETESDALLLENNLIKKYKPKYNVLLKDDKTFPWICIKNEKFPRVFSTRKMVRDGSEYFGPYTSVLMVNTLLKLIRQLYQLRTCKYDLSIENIEEGKFKKCLEFHIGNCKGPCEKLQFEDDYENSIKQIRTILKGNINEVINFLRSLMNEYSVSYRFELADSIKQKILLLERYRSKSNIVSSKLNNIDVFSIYEKNNTSWVNFIKVVNGAIVQSHTVEVLKRFDEKLEDILLFAIIDIREKVNSDAIELIVPLIPNVIIPGIKFIVPKTGDKKRLLELSERNARQLCLLKHNEIRSKSYSKKTSELLERIKIDLRMKDLPLHIECFDNSNIQGSSPVAACIVFKNAKPAKSDYRHYNVKSVSGINDFASMKEIIFRRFKRLSEEKSDFPQLVIVDGGKGQLNAAIESLKKLKVYNKLTIIGIAKRLEEIYLPNDKIPLYLDKNSPTLRLIQEMRNEAHRFGISFHRNKRSAELIKNELESIKGIGKVSAERLIKEFGSVIEIRKKSAEQLESIVGKKIASLVYNNLKNIEKNN
jgi:excinuclease ABC subunit C